MEPSHKVYTRVISRETKTNYSNFVCYFSPFLSVFLQYSESLFALLSALSLFPLLFFYVFLCVRSVPKSFMPNVNTLWEEDKNEQTRGIKFSLAVVRCFRPPIDDCATVQSSHGLCHLPPPSLKGPSRFGVFETGPLAQRVTRPMQLQKRSSFLGCSVLRAKRYIFFSQTILPPSVRGRSHDKTVQL